MAGKQVSGSISSEVACWSHPDHAVKTVCSIMLIADSSLFIRPLCTFKIQRGQVDVDIVDVVVVVVVDIIIVCLHCRSCSCCLLAPLMSLSLFLSPAHRAKFGFAN